MRGLTACTVNELFVTCAGAGGALPTDRHYDGKSFLQVAALCDSFLIHASLFMRYAQCVGA